MVILFLDISIKKKNEIKSLKKLKSKYVPKLFRVLYNESNLFLIEEKAGRQTLKKFIKKYFIKFSVKFYF